MIYILYLYIFVYSRHTYIIVVSLWPFQPREMMNNLVPFRLQPKELANSSKSLDQLRSGAVRLQPSWLTKGINGWNVLAKMEAVCLFLQKMLIFSLKGHPTGFQMSSSFSKYCLHSHLSCNWPSFAEPTTRPAQIKNNKATPNFLKNADMSGLEPYWNPLQGPLHCHPSFPASWPELRLRLLETILEVVGSCRWCRACDSKTERWWATKGSV